MENGEPSLRTSYYCTFYISQISKGVRNGCEGFNSQKDGKKKEDYVPSSSQHIILFCDYLNPSSPKMEIERPLLIY